jgi:ADP-heptose:LPS heptosyltransferase
VLTTPVIRWLKNQMAGAQIHYLTKKNFAGILEANPYLDKIYSIQKTTRELLVDLKKEQYDYVVDLHNNLRSLTVKTYLNVPSFSVKKYHFQRLQMVWFKNRTPFAGHVVERYLSCLGPLNIHDDGLGLDYFIPDESAMNSEQLGGLEPRQYTALVIGAKHYTKRLPIEKLKELVQQIPGKIILLGGKEDLKIAEELSSLHPEKISNACGKLSLHESAFMIKNAQVVISHDTGLMHIAAAFQKTIISIWGGTVPELGMTPWMPQNMNLSHIVEVKNLRCRPCSKIGRNDCPEKHFKCMRDILVSEIVQKMP